MFAAAGPYLPAMQAYLDRVMAQFGSDAAQTADQVAEVILGVLQAERPPLRVQTGPWAEAFVATKLRDLDGSAVAGRDQYLGGAEPGTGATPVRRVGGDPGHSGGDRSGVVGRLAPPGARIGEPGPELQSGRRQVPVDEDALPGGDPPEGVGRAPASGWPVDRVVLGPHRPPWVVAGSSTSSSPIRWLA